MVPALHGLAFLLVSFVASLLSLYFTSVRKSSLVALAVAVAVSFVAAYAVYGSSNLGMVYIGVAIAAISTALADVYLRKPRLFTMLIVLLVAGFAYGILAKSATIAIAGMFSIGTIAGLLHNDFFERGSKAPGSSFNRRLQIEIRRDVVHIMIGVLVVAVILLIPQSTAVDIIFFLILLGYLLNNSSALRYSRRSNTFLHKFYTRANGFERMGTRYGLGAIYLAAGVALLLGFIHSSNFLLFSIIALLFADPAATIVGATVGGPSVPHNRSKSFAGTITFFVVSAFLGYFLIGTNAFVFAFILALVESLGIFVDDNIGIAIICTAIYAIAYL